MEELPENVQIEEKTEVVGQNHVEASEAKSNGHAVDFNLEEVQAQINEISALFRLEQGASLVKETAAS
jgi:hypothetical protein